MTMTHDPDTRLNGAEAGEEPMASPPILVTALPDRQVILTPGSMTIAQPDKG